MKNGNREKINNNKFHIDYNRCQKWSKKYRMTKIIKLIEEYIFKQSSYLTKRSKGFETNPQTTHNHHLTNWYISMVLAEYEISTNESPSTYISTSPIFLWYLEGGFEWRRWLWLSSSSDIMIYYGTMKNVIINRIWKKKELYTILNLNNERPFCEHWTE